MKDRLAFGQDVLAQAMGTVIGGGALFLIGKLSGVLGGVDWAEVVKVGIGIAAALAALLASAGTSRLFQKARQKEREQATKRLEAMTPEEAVAINAYMDKARWNNLDAERRKELEALIVQMVTRDVDAHRPD